MKMQFAPYWTNVVLSYFTSRILYQSLSFAGLSLSNGMRAGCDDPLTFLAAALEPTVHPSLSDFQPSMPYPNLLSL
jgi:hypothetical protein